MNFLITILFNYYNFFSYHNFFELSQVFSIITTFFNYNNIFQLSQFFSILTIFFSYHNLLYQNFFQSLYNLWHYLYEHKPTCEFHHLTIIFYCQNMTKIFSDFHKFLIYAFYFEFFLFYFVPNKFFIKQVVF